MPQPVFLDTRPFCFYMAFLSHVLLIFLLFIVAMYQSQAEHIDAKLIVARAELSEFPHSRFVLTLVWFRFPPLWKRQTPILVWSSQPYRFQFLLAQPFLRNSELLFTFLTSKTPFTSSLLSELNLGRLVKSVPLKLTKEVSHLLCLCILSSDSNLKLFVHILLFTFIVIIRPNFSHASPWLALFSCSLGSDLFSDDEI